MIGWAAPEDFQSAANVLKNLIKINDPRIKPLIDSYKIEWDRLIGEGADATAEEYFSRGLSDVTAIAHYAQFNEANTMTLGYYW